MKLFALSLVGVALAGVGCHPRARAPALAGSRTPEESLARLHQALTTGDPSLDAVADTQTLAEGRFLAQTVRIRLFAGENPMTAQTFRTTLEDLATESTPHRALSRRRAFLGDGRCARLGDVPLWPELQALPERDVSWPPEAMALRRKVGERLRGLSAGRYQCTGSAPMRAYFLRRAGGFWMVGALEPEA